MDVGKGREQDAEALLKQLRSLLCAYFSASVTAPALLYLLCPYSRCYRQNQLAIKSVTVPARSIVKCDYQNVI